MNTIKVRCWETYSEEMIYSDKEYEDNFISFDGGRFEVFWYDPCIAKIEGGEVVETEGWRLLPSIQMLWIGKQDIKGNDIYAGDIVKTPPGRICKVYWLDTPAFCGWDLLALNGAGIPPKGWRDIEVIGNEYENPELLQVE